jgi:hypothetical protein
VLFGFLNIAVDVLVVGVLLYGKIVPIYHIEKVFFVLIPLSLVLQLILAEKFSNNKTTFLKIPTNWLMLLILLMSIGISFEEFSLDFSGFG